MPVTRIPKAALAAACRPLTARELADERMVRLALYGYDTRRSTAVVTSRKKLRSRR